MGWRSSPTMGEWSPASLVFEDVRVPSCKILGELGWGVKLARLAPVATIPSGAVGASERLFKIAIEYSKDRVSTGHPIAEYQAIQQQIADSHVEIEAVKYLTLLAA
ncbi:acyl-CoA dehydrogenase family protein [Bradyrhizobium cytisi]|uniref:acyl-CoA dehydrogenase family protein n=1 Tax=Bradyrhizobium cytisi TaxID=515489 RepID=UPI001AEDA806|nr:acyl-CoA dehydrogenase family protein [Bradyrhizobium cytisi]